MTKEDFKARVSMAYEGREQWEAFLDRVWAIHTSELPHWISVADELPSYVKWVITCDNAGIVSIAKWDIEGWHELDGYPHPEEVAYWAPLPMAPPILNRMRRHIACHVSKHIEDFTESGSGAAIGRLIRQASEKGEQQ